MNEFNRETRYYVVKIADLEEANVTREETEVLNKVFEKVNAVRAARGKQPLRCCVIEEDWPEYDNAWRAIEDRMSGIPHGGKG